MRHVDNECGHLSHRYWEFGDAKDARFGTHDRFSSYMRYEPCPEPFERAYDEPPVGTVVEAPCGKRFRRYESGWGGVSLVIQYPDGRIGEERPMGQWRPMWEAWGDLTVVDEPLNPGCERNGDRRG